MMVGMLYSQMFEAWASVLGSADLFSVAFHFEEKKKQQTLKSTLGWTSYCGCKALVSCWQPRVEISAGLEAAELLF